MFFFQLPSTSIRRKNNMTSISSKPNEPHQPDTTTLVVSDLIIITDGDINAYCRKLPLPTPSSSGSMAVAAATTTAKARFRPRRCHDYQRQRMYEKRTGVMAAAAAAATAAHTCRRQGGKRSVAKRFVTEPILPYLCTKPSRRPKTVAPVTLRCRRHLYTSIAAPESCTKKCEEEK